MNITAAARAGYGEIKKEVIVEYESFEGKGYYIGSGVIESVNKMMMGQRMKQWGMCWNINGG